MSDPQNWFEFATRFVGLFDYIPVQQAPEGCSWRLGSDWETVEHDLEAVEARHAPAIQAAIERLCTTDSTGPVSPQVRYFLGLRGAVLEDFLLSLSAGQSSVFPYPSGVPTLSILRWLLVDWWRVHGARHACKLRLQEDYLHEP